MWTAGPNLPEINIEGFGRLRKKILERDTPTASVVEDSYRRLARSLQIPARKGAREELLALLQAVVNVIQRETDPTNPRAGTARVQPLPLPPRVALEKEGGLPELFGKAPDWWS